MIRAKYVTQLDKLKMLLTELTGYKKAQEISLAGFLARLIRDKKITLGQGAFSFVVIPANKDYVYKVWTQDDAWEHYLKLVQQHPNEHFIRTKGKISKVPLFFKRPKDVDATLRVLRIEKLKELNNIEKVDISQLVKFFRDVQVKKLTGDDVPEIMQRIERLVGSKPVFPESLVHAMLFLVENMGKNNLDFHYDNIMKREDGTFVISDPFFTYTTIKTASDILDMGSGDEPQVGRKRS